MSFLLNNQELPPQAAFHTRLRNSNLFEKEFPDCEKLIGSSLTTESLLVKMRLSEKPPTGAENYPYLQKVWEQEKLQSFKELLSWYNYKDDVPTLEAVQKMVEFYHSKGTHMRKLGCPLPKLANICLHSFTSAKFYPFTESDKDLLSKFREDVVGGPSKVFKRKTVADETHIRKSKNVCKSIVQKDASQLQPYSVSQPKTTGLYTRYQFDADFKRFQPRQNKFRRFELW